MSETYRAIRRALREIPELPEDVASQLGEFAWLEGYSGKDRGAIERTCCSYVGYTTRVSREEWAKKLREIFAEPGPAASS